MGVKVGATTSCFKLSQPLIPYSPKRLRGSIHVNLFGSDRSVHRTRSCDFSFHFKSNPRPSSSIRRVSSASLESFSDEDFFEKINELYNAHDAPDSDSDAESGCDCGYDMNNESSYPGIIIPGSIERKANNLGIPVSLRIIKRKMQWQEGFRDTGKSAVTKAFSSMVFIIRELHAHSLQMRELLFKQDLQGILGRVQQEMDASFVWLFQQVFSHTPTLMVYVMILLVNFTVYSMGNHASIAATAEQPAATESASLVAEAQDAQRSHSHRKLDASSVNMFSVLKSSSGGKSTAIGGSNGGGGKVGPIGSGRDGDGWFDKSDQLKTIVPDGGAVQPSSLGTEEELSLWNKIFNEASKMQASWRDEALDHETVKTFVSPIRVEIEADDYQHYSRTELFYQAALPQHPNNPMLLANYAQFLYLVARDYDRAEEYFKKAVAVEPADAEAYSKYANFLWRVRNDLWAAEETFLEAISAEPTSSYHAANYAHFLWNTGGEDTCFPINSSGQV